METGGFLIQADNTLIRMVAQPYDSEALLQRLLAEHPDLLGGDQINSADPRRWLLIDRELGVPAEQDGGDWWAVDHLFLDQDAVPTFVEVKRAADTRTRREVVAQMLDYAANATENWPVDRMREAFARRSVSASLDPATLLEDLLGPEGDEEVFWSLAKTNLREGRNRLLFVADRIPEPLRRIVEFLNRQMTPAEVLAVKIRQFASLGEPPLRTLVPRVIGQTEQARVAKAGSRTTTKATVITRQEYLDAVPADRREIAVTILRVAEAVGFVTTEHRRPAAASVWITLPGVAGTPISLGQDYLWVSLGRHHAALRAPSLNQALRQAIFRVVPSLKSAADPDKTEVGIPLDKIDPREEEPLRNIFTIVKAGLEQGRQSPNGDRAEAIESLS
ncbi:MAG: hypothetical protein M3R02_10880 [Chloroflexota bacterium]|nr:hypothetical protein [Chloroflexota bacterium]